MVLEVLNPVQYDVTGMVAKGVTFANIAILRLTGFLLFVWNSKNTASIPGIIAI